MANQDAPRLAASEVGLSPAVGGYVTLQDAIDNGAIGGGGGIAVRKFPYAYNTAGILTGATLYTPTIGDILLDGWVSITTAWDGTTPLGDFGPFLAVNTGYLGTFGYGPVDFSFADTSLQGLRQQNDGQPNSDALENTIVAPAAGGGNRYFPSAFVTADPIKVCVSQDGTNNGMDPGSTQGAAVLYLVTATPV